MQTSHTSCNSSSATAGEPFPPHPLYGDGTGIQKHSSGTTIRKPSCLIDPLAFSFPAAAHGDSGTLWTTGR